MRLKGVGQYMNSLETKSQHATSGMKARLDISLSAGTVYSWSCRCLFGQTLMLRVTERDTNDD
jgi:hypothetical protein